MTDVEGRWVVKFKSYDIDGKNEKEAFENFKKEWDNAEYWEDDIDAFKSYDDFEDDSDWSIVPYDDGSEETEWYYLEVTKDGIQKLELIKREAMKAKGLESAVNMQVDKNPPKNISAFKVLIPPSNLRAIALQAFVNNEQFNALAWLHSMMSAWIGGSRKPMRNKDGNYQAFHPQIQWIGIDKKVRERHLDNFEKFTCNVEMESGKKRKTWVPKWNGKNGIYRGWKDSDKKYALVDAWGNVD